MLQTWFKIFFRNQKKNWLNIVINISGLTLGLAGLLIVLLYLKEEKSYNQWNPYKDTIYRANIKHRDDGIWFTGNAGQYHVYKSEIPEVEETLMVRPFYNSRVISLGEVSEFTKKVIITEPQFFNFFPYKIIDGSTKKFAESRKNIGLSEVLAKRVFKNEKAVGNIIKIGAEDYVVTCIYEIPRNSHHEPELLMQFNEPFEANWGNHNNEVFCKVKKGTDPVILKQKMDAIFIDKLYKYVAEEEGVSLKVYEERYGFREVTLDKLDTIYLKNTANRAGPSGTGNYQLLMVLLGLSILLIIISCVNFINLSIASASQRAKEVGVKKTLGSSKKQLVLQYVTEVLLQGFLSFLLALIIVELILPFFNRFVDKDISIFNIESIGTLFFVAFVVSFFIGVLPAIYLSNFKEIEVLKGNVSKSKKGNFARNIMLGLQFLISGFFIISMLIINSQIQFMMHKDLGFDKEQVLTVKMFNIEGNRYKKYQLTKKVLKKNKNIVDVTSSMFIPGEGFVSGTSLSHKNISFNCASNSVDLNYNEFADIKILKGRGYSEKFASDTINSIIINETAATRLGIYNAPLGKKVRLGWMGDEQKDLEVIGVIKDYHFGGLDEKIEPMFLVPWDRFEHPKQWFPAIQFKLKAENINETIVDIEEFWRANIDTKYPFKYEFLDQKFAQTYEKYEKQQTLFLILSLMVVVIALLGLFALATLTIQQRLKEVAIRKTLGASVNEIMYQLIKSFLKVTFIASLILIPIAYYFMQNWLDNFSYRIDMPVMPYIITPIILVVLVFLVVGFKAFNATKVDLIKYLKFE